MIKSKILSSVELESKPVAIFKQDNEIVVVSKNKVHFFDKDGVSTFSIELGAKAIKACSDGDRILIAVQGSRPEFQNKYYDGFAIVDIPTRQIYREELDDTITLNDLGIIDKSFVIICELWLDDELHPIILEVDITSNFKVSTKTHEFKDMSDGHLQISDGRLYLYRLDDSDDISEIEFCSNAESFIRGL